MNAIPINFGAFTQPFGTIVTGTFLFYILFWAMFYLFSDSVLYQPPKPSSYPDTPQIIKITTKTGLKISALYLTHPDAKATLLFSHGNAEDLGTLYPFLTYLRDQSYNILAYDYPGYGTSDGKPSEEKLNETIFACYEFLKNQKVAPNNIFLYGRSLGSGPSIWLASTQPVAGVILQAPFISVYRVITYFPIFPFDKFNNLKSITKIKSPILFIHGRSDEIIPIWHSKVLSSQVTTDKQVYWVDKAGHNDLIAVAGASYFKVLRDFVTRLE